MKNIVATCFSRFQIIDSILYHTRSYEYVISRTQICCALYTLFHILHICICGYIVKQVFFKCVFHMADMAVGSLAPLTFGALGMLFLYVLDTFFQNLTASLACMDLAMASTRAISSRC